MEYFPLFAEVKDRRVVVIGGGEVASRKIALLKRADARIRVIAPTLHHQVQDWHDRGDIEHVNKTFVDSDLDDAWLVVAATGDPRVNEQVAAAAESRRVWCNVVDAPKHCSFITPAIVDRSPLMIAISSAGAAPVLARMWRERLERQLHPQLGKLALLARHWRGRVKRALKSLSARRRFWETLFDSEAVTAIERGQPQQAIRETGALLRQHRNDERVRRTGEAWLVGAGPGDPGLLTIRAQALLQRADIVLHDRLVSAEVLELARRDAELIDVGKPIPGTGNANRVQSDTNQLLVDLVAAGNRVCRLKGGDPFIFGRGGEEVQALVDAGLPFQVVPGITAAAACGAYAGIPLTHRDYAQSVALVTAHGKRNVDQLDWASLARDRQTLAFYMGVSRYGQVSARLIAHGRAASTPVAIVERGSLPTQRVIVTTLGDLPTRTHAAGIQAPAILYVGEVAQLASSHHWFGDPPITIPPANPLAAATG
ncbi:MAG: siroheme synthase CysG, partial [Pseudomonadota bacterium]